MAAPETPSDKPRVRSHGVYKSGYLAISSKGLGWKSWKRRWFLLTRTSLVFFKAEPKGNIDGSLALGGIDLNSSGSVHVKTDKKQLTLVFPDGRAFTLRAEGSDEFDEWRDALEQALAAAPRASLVGQSGDTIFRQDLLDSLSDFTGEMTGSRRPIKSLVVGRPILLALEDIDGSPSFLEKAIRFVEQHGVKLEGILRVSADVAEVEKRVLEYEQGGNTEFADEENAHVVGDCIKHVLRELPSSPVPASCCAALLQSMALEDTAAKLEAVKMATEETFPEPNRRLLQRLLKMMRTVVEHQSVNRMTTGAAAACMAPLLLRPLLAGECGPSDEDQHDGPEHDDGAQIRAATKSATQAQSIVTFLTEHFDQIFTEELESTGRPPMFWVFRTSPFWQDNDDDDVEIELDDDDDEEVETKRTDTSSGTDKKLRRDAVRGSNLSDSSLSEFTNWSDGGSGSLANFGLESRGAVAASPHEEREGGGGLWRDKGGGETPEHEGTNGAGGGHQRKPSLARAVAAGGKPFSTGTPRSLRVGMDSRNQMDVLGDEDAQLHVLELTRQDLRASLSREVRANAVLRDSLVSRKAELGDRRLALQKEVAALREQLKAQQDAHAVMERSMGRPQTSPPQLDAQTQAELAEIGGMEKDVQRLKSELTALQRQLEHVRRQQQNPITATAATTMERRQKIEALLSLKSQLHNELERTMTLCQEEQQKNVELEEKRKRDDPGALEKSVAQQRQALAESQASLQAEMQRGKELRKRLQVAQRAGAVAKLENAMRSENVSGSSTPLARAPGPGGASPQRLDAREFEARRDARIIGVLGLDAPSSSAGELGARKSREESGGSGLSSLGTADPGGSGSPGATSLAELSSRLEHFKERRSQLMQQLSQLSTEPPSPRRMSRVPSAVGTPREGAG